MSSNIFTMILGLIPGALVFVAIIGGAALLLWLVLGRKKKGEDRMIGILKETSVFRGHTGNGGPRMK